MIPKLATSTCTEQYAYPRPGSVVLPQAPEHQLPQELCVNPADIFVSSDVAARRDSLNPCHLVSRGAESIVNEVKILTDHLNYITTECSSESLRAYAVFQDKPNSLI